MRPMDSTNGERPSRSGRIALAATLAAVSSIASVAAVIATRDAAAPLAILPIRPRTEKEISGLDRHSVFDLAAGDVDGDGRPELLVSSPGTGRVEILRGPFPRRGGAAERPAPAAVVAGEPGAGYSPSGSSLLVADVDGLAGAEVVIGNSAARRVLVYRDALKRPPRILGEDAAARIYVSAEWDVGAALATSPSRPEIAIGGTSATSSRVYLVPGDVAGLARIVDLDAPRASHVLRQRGERGVREHFGWDLEYADWDGDGVADLVVSIQAATGEDGGLATGEVAIVSRRPPGPPGAAIATVRGGARRDRFGRSVAVADFDRDGRPDLLASSTHSNVAIARSPGGSVAPEKNVGKVYLVPGSRLRPGTTLSVRDRAVSVLHGSEREERFGWVLLPADFDGDGALDLLVTAKHAGGDARSGRAVFVSSALLADPRPWAERAAAARVVAAPAGVKHFGLAGAAADFDGDGCADAALAGIDSASGDEAEGRVVIVYGAPDLFSSSLDVALATRVIR